MRTQIGIVGAGPAGLLLSHLLHLHGIESVVLETRSRRYCETRIRAGILEQGTADLLSASGVGERMGREGLVQTGIVLRFDRRDCRIDLSGLTGRTITVYGQQEIVKDLIAARLTAGGEIFFEVTDVEVADYDTEAPKIRFRHDGTPLELQCDFIAGCDGSHGVCRPSVPAGVLTTHEQVFPHAWLGILGQVPPASIEVIYSSHARGFALLSVRSPELSRLYLQCAPAERLEEWPDDRIWEELCRRLERNGDWTLEDGPVLQKGITALRSFVVTPMQYGRLFLVGDAAHVVPLSGAKGLNLAAADVRVLARAFEEFYVRGRRDLLAGYSDVCLRRVWKVQRFSWWMTWMLHRPTDGEFADRIRLAELIYVTDSRAASTALAENYVGLPFDDG